MKIISWNVNGLRACVNHGFVGSIKDIDADIVALQEIKVQENQIPKQISQLSDYIKIWNFGVRPGYSGVATFTRPKPEEIVKSIGIKKFDDEGRVIITKYNIKGFKFSLYNVYFPNGKMSDGRLKYKLDFYDELLKLVQKKRKDGEKIIICGDFNTAHKEIDLKNPKSNEKYSGFLPVERKWLDKYLNEGFIDSFRGIHGDKVKYSWWTYRFNARAKDVGWRIDYFFVDSKLKKNLKDAFILNNIYGSDHCPVGITLNF
ncbi:MAG: exodeoxyribonuclease III [Nitrospiraceae bacterium]|nr:exodeoxyribonuclease III [Nitrospiraceae bacterium]